MSEKIANSNRTSNFQPARLAAWASLAMLSGVSAYYLYQHPLQLTRSEAVATADPMKQVQQVAQQQVVNATRDVLAEVRRLSAAVGTLNTDRDRIYGRLSSIEQTVDSITGSLSKMPSKPASAAAPVSSAVEGAPTAPQEEKLAKATTPSSDTLTPLASAPAIETAVQRTSFGVDLGTASNVEGLRAMWRKDLSASAILAGLQPVIAIRESPGAAGFNLRLIAGPLSDAAAAARLCVTLSAGTQRACEPSVYDGQRLAMDVAPPPPVTAVRKKPIPLRLPTAPKPQPVLPQILPR